MGCYRGEISEKKVAHFNIRCTFYFGRHGIKVCCAKRTGTPYDNMRVEIVDNEEPMATEEDVGYEDLRADTYATIGESNMMKTDKN